MITDKIDSITNVSEKYRNSFLPAPKSVKIELTGTAAPAFGNFLVVS